MKDLEPANNYLFASHWLPGDNIANSAPEGPRTFPRPARSSGRAEMPRGASRATRTKYFIALQRHCLQVSNGLKDLVSGRSEAMSELRSLSTSSCQLSIQLYSRRGFPA